MNRLIVFGSLITATLVVVTGCGGGGGSPAQPIVPTVTLGAAAADVALNAPVVLTWASTNASSCEASGSWRGSLGASGSQTVTVAQNSTYSISCTGAGGTATGSTSINAWSAPSATITADNTAVLPNNVVSLTWSSQNAKNCTGSGGLSGAFAISGTKTTDALTSTTTFSIACSNPIFPAATSAVTVTVSPTLSLDVSVAYQAPGGPVVNAARTNYVPDWAHPTVNPVSFVYVELDDSIGKAVQSAWADANGVAHFGGLDPTVTYTPVIQSRIKSAPLGIDFIVVNNTVPLDITKGSFRTRYGPYSTVGPAYKPATKSANQGYMLTIPDGWDATAAKLVDANRVAGPYELLAIAANEAQVVSSAMPGASPNWRPLTILWSVKNKGGLTAPPDNFDQGVVTGSGGFWSSGHGSIDASGQPSGTSMAEDHIYLSGDPTFEIMEIYPFVMAHEMGHFAQAQFSTLQQAAGNHAYSDFEDPLLAWIEGNASAIAALVLDTPKQLRLFTVGGQIAVSVGDISNNTINGNPQSWPVGWYQETTTTGLMWSIYDPNGGTKLSRAATLAPMFSSAWKQGPWLNSIWPYLHLLKQDNAGATSAIDTLSAAHGVASTGNDVWGSRETNFGNRAMQDALPIYTSVPIGQTISVCSVGAPLEYNKEGNRRLLRLQGDGASHTLKVQGPNGTVPLVNNQYSPGSAVFTASGIIPIQGAIAEISDCRVALGEFSSDTAACSEPAAPPAEQCWLITLQ